MKDTDRASKAAAHLTNALDHLERAQTAIRDAQTEYPDKEAGDYVYGQVLGNTAALIGYVRMLRVPAQAYAGDVAGLKRGVKA